MNSKVTYAEQSDLFPLSTKKVLQLPILLYAEYIWRTEETGVIVIILEDRVWAVKGLFVHLIYYRDVWQCPWPPPSSRCH